MSRARDLADSADKDIAGTLTLDGLTVDASGTPASLNRTDGNAALLELKTSGSVRGYIGADTTGSTVFYSGAAAERMRIDSSGNVMVGGTVAGNAGTISLNVGNVGSTNGGLQLWGTTTGTHYIQFGDDSGTAANHYRGYMAYAHNGDSLRFGTASTERMRIDSSGSLTLDPNASGMHYLKLNTSTSGDGHILLQRNSVNKFQIAAGTSNELQFYNYTAGSESMRIDSSGNVGIGTSSPSALFQVEASDGTAGGAIKYTSSGVASGYMSADAGGLCLATDTAGITFRTGITGNDPTDTGLERMRIDSSGNLLIGRQSQIHGGKISLDYTNGVTAGMAIKDTQTSGTGVPLQVVNGSGTIVGSITQNQSSTSFNTTSDHRLKENVVELTGATDRLKQLEPKRFNFIADADTTVDGFLAHEVQTVVPEAITGTHNEVDADGNPIYQGIDQSKLVPLLVATIKELEARITALENA